MLSDTYAIPAEDPQLADAIRNLGDEFRERVYEIAGNLERLRSFGWKGRGSSSVPWFLFELDDMGEAEVRERLRSEGLDPDKFMIGRIGDLRFYRPTSSAKSWPGDVPHEANRVIEAARKNLRREK